MIRQRILYVGIGGSGLDLGIKLDEALRREICGLDGRALRRKGAAFAGLEPNRLPGFIQSIYIDFAAEALDNVTKKIKGGNAVAAKNLIPTIEDYPALATDLRLNCPNDIKWIPPADGEPSTRPLNGGAGQFPTVGRAALFNSIRMQGYERSLGSTIKEAIGALANNMGDLDAYTNNQSNSSIAVYVGFSMSGGTGCGLFLDVIHLLMHELYEQLQDNSATIVPIIMLPSTFDKLPIQKARRARLNAAPALLDMTRMIEQLQSPTAAARGNVEMRYPDAKLGSVSVQYLGKAPMIPVASVVSRPIIMDRDDVSRSIAASIVAQASSSGQKQGAAGAGVTNKNSFVEDLINDIPDISEPHFLGLGTHPLMPMVASSLTLPSRTIADVIAMRIIADGISEMFREFEASSGVSDELVNDLHRECGLKPLVDAETFDTETRLSFVPPTSIRSASDLESSVVKLRGGMTNAKPIIEQLIRDTVRQKSVFNVLDATQALLKGHPELSLPVAIRVASAGLTKLETKSSQQTPTTASKGKSTSKRRRMGLPQRVDSKTAVSRFNAERNRFIEEVREMWWAQWNNSRAGWVTSVEQGSTKLSQLLQNVRELVEEYRSQVSSHKADLAENRIGVVNFIPTGGRSIEVALDVLFTETCDRVRNDRGINDQSAVALLNTLATTSESGNAWAAMVEEFSQNKPKSAVFDVLLEVVRSAVETAMTTDQNRNGTLRSLGQLLVEATTVNGSSDADALRASLGNLVPDPILPSGSSKSARVLISYPGERNSNVEKMLLETLTLGGAFKSLLNKNTQLEFSPTGDSDVLTVNINLIGQGLLDNPETREILLSWAQAVENPLVDDQ
jgi:hypothetical protein